MRLNNTSNILRQISVYHGIILIRSASRRHASAAPPLGRSISMTSVGGCATRTQGSSADPWSATLQVFFRLDRIASRIAIVHLRLYSDNGVNLVPASSSTARHGRPRRTKDNYVRHIRLYQSIIDKHVCRHILVCGFIYFGKKLRHIIWGGGSILNTSIKMQICQEHLIRVYWLEWTFDMSYKRTLFWQGQGRVTHLRCHISQL
jgi:hypothetical protein